MAVQTTVRRRTIPQTTAAQVRHHGHPEARHARGTAPSFPQTGLPDELPPPLPHPQADDCLYSILVAIIIGVSTLSVVSLSESQRDFDSFVSDEFSRGGLARDVRAATSARALPHATSSS